MMRDSSAVQPSLYTPSLRRKSHSVHRGFISQLSMDNTTLLCIDSSAPQIGDLKFQRGRHINLLQQNQNGVLWQVKACFLLYFIDLFLFICSVYTLPSLLWHSMKSDWLDLTTDMQRDIYFKCSKSCL